MHANSHQPAGLLQASYLQPTSYFLQSHHASAETVLFACGVPWSFVSPETISQKSRWLSYWLSTALLVSRSTLLSNQACPTSIQVMNVVENYAHCRSFLASQLTCHSCIIKRILLTTSTDSINTRTMGNPAKDHMTDSCDLKNRCYAYHVTRPGVTLWHVFI